MRSSSCSRFLDAVANTHPFQWSLATIQGSSLPDISVEPQRSSGGDLLQTPTSLDLEEEFTEVVEGSVAKLDFLLVFVFALVGAGLRARPSCCKTTSSTVVSRKFSVVSALNYNQPKILQQQQRHDLHKACRAAVPLRWTSKTVVSWLDLLEESECLTSSAVIS